MKYNININQLVLAGTNLDLVDCAILDWLIVFCTSKNDKISSKRKNGMTWVDYGQLIKDMPLLRINSKGAITPRIKKLEAAGFIQTQLRDNSKLFVNTTELVDELFFTSTVHEYEQERSPKRTASVHDGETTIILDNNTKSYIHSQKDYLISIPEDELTELSMKYKASKKEIISKGDQLYHWINSNGKRKYKNFRSLLMGALSRDYGLRPASDDPSII